MYVRYFGALVQYFGTSVSKNVNLAFQVPTQYSELGDIIRRIQNKLQTLKSDLKSTVTHATCSDKTYYVLFSLERLQEF